MMIHPMIAMSNAPRGRFYVVILAITMFLALLSLSPYEIRANATSWETENELHNITTFKLVVVEMGTGKPISGARFGIYEAASGRKVDEITTGSSGIAYSVKLSEGAYYLTEWLTPDGYKINAAEILFYIKAREIKEIIVTKEPEKSVSPAAANSYVQLTMRVDRMEAILPGGVFGIYNAATDEKAAELITGEDGTAKSPALPAGSYYLLEIQTPAGYKLKADKIEFSLMAWETKELTASTVPSGAETPTTGILILSVKAETTGVRLSGALFGIFDTATNGEIIEITTGIDGLAVCELPSGNYYLLEIKAPSGYDVESAPIPFIIDSDATVKVDVTNVTEKGGVKVINKGITGEKVENAVFGIYNAYTDVRIGEFIIGEDGTALCVLPSGVYYIAQEQAPDGYTLNNDKHSFFVTSSQTINVQIYNRRDITTTPENSSVRKAGESQTYRSYALLAVVAVICGVSLFKRSKRQQA